MGGMPSVGSLAILPNTSVKTMVVKMGLIKNQRGPKMVCLNEDTKSLFTNMKTKSRYRQTSFKLS